MTESYPAKQMREKGARLRALLDRPLPLDDQSMHADTFEPWDLFSCVGSYSSSLDDLAIAVLIAVRDHTTFDLLEGPDAVAAELFMHMLADSLCSYGTSPRGIWPDGPAVEGMWQELIDKWTAYAKVKWS